MEKQAKKRHARQRPSPECARICKEGDEERREPSPEDCDVESVFMTTVCKAMQESKRLSSQESKQLEAQQSENGASNATQSKVEPSAAESHASLLQHFRDKFGDEGRVEVRVLQRFGSFRHAQVKINGDRISLHGEDITSFVEFPKHAAEHANQLLSSSWSEDLRYFVVYVDGYMTMVELVPEATREPKIEKELNLVYRSGVIAALQSAKRRGDSESEPSILLELIHRTRQFTYPFRADPLDSERHMTLQKRLGVPYFENPTVSGLDARAILNEYFDAGIATYRSAKLWNRAGLLEAIAFMDFECALKCFEAGIRVAEDDATEAMIRANLGQVSGEAIVAQFNLLECCASETLSNLNRAKTLDPRFVDHDYGFPILLKPWLLYNEDTLETLRRQVLEASACGSLSGIDEARDGHCEGLDGQK